jgi:trimeric autotransporter adhesin
MIAHRSRVPGQLPVFVVQVVIWACLAVLLPLTLHAAGPDGTPPQAPPDLRQFLDANGHVDVEAVRKTGYTGPIDLSGLNTHLDPETGELVIQPGDPGTGERAEGDQYWAPGFGDPNPLAGVNGSVTALVEYEGALIAGGSFYRAGGVEVSGVARWDGTEWTAVGEGLDYLNALVVYDGALMAAAGSGVYRFDGASWNSIGSCSGGVYALHVFDGKLIAGGSFTEIDGIPAPRIAAWDGDVWTPLSTGMDDGRVNCLATYNSELIAAGSFFDCTGTRMNSIARWDGYWWRPLSSGIQYGDGNPGEVRALSLYAGELVVGGSYSLAGGTPAYNLATWNGLGWRDLYSPCGVVDVMTIYAGELHVSCSYSLYRWTGSQWTYVTATNSTNRTLLPFGPNLIVGGDFNMAGEVEAQHIASWNGQTWSALRPPSGNGFDRDAFALAEYNGEMISGGAFFHAGPASLRYVARWNGTEWASLGAGVNGTVYALALYNGKMIAAGAFTWAGAGPAAFIAAWDGTSWSPLGTGVNTVARALAVHAGELYVGGSFTTAGGASARHVARWDGSAWHDVGGGTDGTVWALTSYDGQLIAGGSFNTAGGVTARAAARWDGSTWRPLDGPGYLNSGTVYSLTSYGGDLMLGGNFYVNVSGGDSPNLARWNAGGWHLLNSYSGSPDGTVRALRVHRDWLIAAGDFSTLGNLSARRIARWDGSNWQALGSGLSNSAYALGSLNESLYAAGYFTAAGGRSAFHIARWDDPSMACHLDVTSPAAQDSTQALCIGQPLEIRWTPSAGCGADVRIDLLNHYGLPCGEISTSTENDGIYSWAVDNGGQCGSGRLIRVTDNSTGSFDDSGSFYVSDPTTPVISYPYGGQYTVGDELDLYWQSNPCYPVRIELLQHGQVCAVLADSTENDGDFHWTVASCSLDPTEYRIRVSLLNGMASDETDGWLSILAEGDDHWADNFGTEGLNNDVVSLLPLSDAVVAGGYFSYGGSTLLNRVGIWNGAAWSPMGNGRDDAPLALASYNGQVVAGGYGPAVSIWDGTAWNPIGSGLNGGVRALAVHGGVLYAGGEFTYAGETPVNHIAVWNGETWGAVGTGFNGVVRSLCSWNGLLIAGGDFNSLSGVPVSVGGIAAWDGQAWSPLSNGPQHGTNGTVYALVRYGSDLVVGGSFAVVDGLQSPMIAQWNGTSWSAMGSGLNGEVYALTLYNGDLIAGGCFYATGYPSYQYVERIARWNGAFWRPLGHGISGNAVFALTQAGPHLYAGGHFTLAGWKPSQDIARWTDSAPACEYTLTNPQAAQVICPGTAETITWTASGGCGGQVRLELWSSTLCQVIAESTENDGSFDWVVPSCGEAYYHIKIQDLSTGQSAMLGTFLIRETGCVTTVSHPNGGDVLMVGTTDTLRWEVHPCCGSSVRLELLREGLPCRLIAASVPNAGYYIWTIAQCGVDSLGYQLRVTDLTTQTFDLSDAVFIIRDVAAGVADEGALPTRTTLYPARPNPAGDEVVFRFDLAREGDVSLEIYNASGQVVATPRHGYTAVGSHSVTWRTVDAAAKPLPSGLYFYRLRTGDLTETRKLLVTR